MFQTGLVVFNHQLAKPETAGDHRPSADRWLWSKPGASECLESRASRNLSGDDHQQGGHRGRIVVVDGEKKWVELITPRISWDWYMYI